MNAVYSGCFPCSSPEVCHVSVNQYENRAGSEEWIVQIKNPYRCSQKNIILSCAGFKPWYKPDPSLITYDAGHIYVQPTIQADDSMEFKYESKTKFDMLPLSSTMCC